MSLAIRCIPETVRTLAAGSVAAGYTAVGSAFNNPIRILIIQNLTDQSVMFSFDGTNDHLPLLANGYVVLDVSSNKNQTDGFFFAVGTTIYVKQIGAPSSGSVYVSVFYGERS